MGSPVITAFSPRSSDIIQPQCITKWHPLRFDVSTTYLKSYLVISDRVLLIHSHSGGIGSAYYVCLHPMLLLIYSWYYLLQLQLAPTHLYNLDIYHITYLLYYLFMLLLLVMNLFVLRRIIHIYLFFCYINIHIQIQNLPLMHRIHWSIHSLFGGVWGTYRFIWNWWINWLFRVIYIYLWWIMWIF